MFSGGAGSSSQALGFIHSVVVHRRDDAIRGWTGWLCEDPFVCPSKWFRPELVLPAPSLQCDPALTPGGPGVLSDPSRIDEQADTSFRVS